MASPLSPASESGSEKMFVKLEQINHRPQPFEFYTAADLWTNEHTARQMLAFHLNEEIDLSSRKREFIDRSVEWIDSHFHIGPRLRIADFGCGPGLYTTQLARRGASVTGIDFSSNSLAHARKVADQEQLNIAYVNQDYLQYETTERFDLILMIMCDFCALSPSQRRRMLAKFHRLLARGGAVLLDVYSINAFERRQEAASYGLNLLDGFWSPNPYYGFLNTFKYDAEKVVLDKYTIVEPQRTRTVYNWLQHFTPQSIEVELREAGFMMDSLFADVAGTPFDPTADEFAVVARHS